jgi:RNA polymerase sigma-70 factor (ECF subfamily)
MDLYEASPSLTLDNESEFEKLFKSHFKCLHSYACTLLKDTIMAEEMVQNVFCRLWEKSEALEIKESIAGYLYRSVYNECMNYLKHLKVRESYQHYVLTRDESSVGALHELEANELAEKLDSALEKLPEKCRTIFQMSRFEELRYQEIAERLDIPIKTVENQMGKALRLLRMELVDFLPVFYLLLLAF